MSIVPRARPPGRSGDRRVARLASGPSRGGGRSTAHPPRLTCRGHGRLSARGPIGSGRVVARPCCGRSQNSHLAARAPERRTGRVPDERECSHLMANRRSSTAAQLEPRTDSLAVRSTSSRRRELGLRTREDPTRSPTWRPPQLLATWASVVSPHEVPDPRSLRNGPARAGRGSVATGLTDRGHAR
jgi:hypothetical protein